MSTIENPPALLAHEEDYHPEAWHEYTLAELGWWVHLLTKRAGHRKDGPKRDKDLEDAQNYLSMMQAILDAKQKESDHVQHSSRP
jgi:hypothetical protein